MAPQADQRLDVQKKDVKPDNILVNISDDHDMRIKDVCLADFGNTVSVDSDEARKGYPLGTPIFRSPETTLVLPFGPPADVWSFGATVSAPFFLFSSFADLWITRFITANGKFHRDNS